ncbi:type IV pilin protein [Massilia sp. S19_KUP03_FR1]|uniref:type IV pilin protein n=1 Tax=Massilia sp. S19_KUP03_FR1 TaxID=3025503 RepID=UPI002FCD0F3E
MRNQGGFTLLEVMVVLVILMILTTLAYPSYARYMTMARRIEGQVALLDALQQQERYFMRNNTYIAFSAASTDPRERQFHAWSGASAAKSAYEIEGRACPGQALADCIEVRATPGTANVDGHFSDPECGVLTQDSVGRRSASGTAGPACWP